MKKIILSLLLTVSSAGMAQSSRVGEKNEPQCGEPCSVCPGGIKQCDKTQSTGSRSFKSIDQNGNKFKKSKARAFKQ